MKRILLLFLFLFSAKSSLLNAQNFGTFASAVWITDCNTSNFFNTTGEGASIIGPVENTFTGTNFGFFIQNSGTLVLRGGEVKTFKNSSGNACSVRMNYRIYLESETPGGFSIIDFPFFEDCNLGSNEFPSGGPCSEGDQKWQRVIADGETTPFTPIDLTAFTPGNYVLEVFYDVTGDLNSPSECDDIVFISDFGNNFKAYFTITATPSFTSENPLTCGGSEGSITISNLNANSTYTFSYSDNGDTIGPNSITTDENGDYVISNLNEGSYSDFNFIINNCTTTSNSQLNLTDPVVNPPISGGNQTVCEDNPIQTLTANASTSDGSIVVWYDAAVDGNIVTNPTLNTVGSTTYYAEAQNETSNCISSMRTAVTLTINPAPAAPTGETTQTICSPLAVIFTLSNLVVNGTNLQWYADAAGTIPLPSDTPLVNNTTYYVTQTVDSCESNEYLAVLVYLNQFVTPTFGFDSELTICENDTVPVLELISINGIEGSWTPASIDNTQNGIYTFEPTDYCANSFTLNVTITPQATPIFNFENEITICTVAQAPILPTTDNNGISGVWSPDVINEENGNTYTFTPNENQCATVFTLTVTISSFPSPVFDFGNTITICSGDDVPILPSVDNNGIDGFWNPAVIDNTTGNTYTFISNNSECASNFTLEVTINQPLIPTFSLPESVCFNSESFSLPTISDNGIEGSWTPASIDNTQNGVYTFEPTDYCANSFTLNVTVTPQATPIFNFENEITICTVAQAPILPTTDNNGISGVWSPDVINEENGNTYTFTPNENQCATVFTLTVTISSFPSPVFDFGNTITICSGDDVPILPSVDNNGIDGFWNPAAIDNTTGNTYTFISNNSECASNFTLEVTINQPLIPTFSLPESVCFNSESFSLPTISDNGIEGSWNPSEINTTQEMDYVFTPNSTFCAEEITTSFNIINGFSISFVEKCENNTFLIEAVLNDNGIGNNYVWSNENNQTIGSNSPILNVTEYIRSTQETQTFPLNFSVAVTNSDGCISSQNISIENIFCGIQKGISPNGDNLNDFFDLALLDVDKLSIFNRYGRKVYSMNNYTNQWNGQTDDGKELPSATYYYVIEFKNGESKTGWIYIMREESR